MFVYKHTETIEYLKNEPAFYEKYKLHGQITPEFLELTMKNFQGIVLYEPEHIVKFSNLH